jgi:hypothetical protein
MCYVVNSEFVLFLPCFISLNHKTVADDYKMMVCLIHAFHCAICNSTRIESQKKKKINTFTMIQLHNYTVPFCLNFEHLAKCSRMAITNLL